MLRENMMANENIKPNSREIETLKQNFPQFFDKDGAFLFDRFKAMLKQSDITLTKEGYPRLILARDLLSDDGVIFISIDDNEQANLKLMCDEVFGEENLIDNIVWDKKSSAKGVPPQNMIVNKCFS